MLILVGCTTLQITNTVLLRKNEGNMPKVVAVKFGLSVWHVYKKWFQHSLAYILTYR